ncbi:MAG TPA: hypothetical protein VH373_16895 [Jatrophihabitantaceae bacterium]|jgi:hypothetical protein
MPKTSSSLRSQPIIVPVLLGLLGVVLIVISVVYFTQNAHQLPGFFPGHESGPAGTHHHHTKHAILALALGVLALIGAWMTAGRKPTS